MTTIDYKAQDEEIDRELAELLAGDDESDDSLDESTESEQTNESVEDVAETTQETDDEINDNDEPVVPEFRYKEAVRAMNKAQQELADKRKQDAERDELIQQLQAQVQALQSKRENKDEQPDSEDVSLDDLAADYPELVGPLIKQIKSLTAQVSAMQGDVENVKGVTTRYQQSEAMTAKERYLSEVKSVHPDAEELVATDEFNVWFQNQPPLIQQAITNATAKDAITALNLYRAEHPVPSTNNKPDRLAQARQAASPNVRSNNKPEKQTTFTLKQIDKMSRDEFMRNEAAIDAAIARGEVY